MRIATLRHDDTTSAVRLDEATAVTISGAADVGALLSDPDWRARSQAACGREYALADVDPRAWAPVVPNPSKIVCVGLNYRQHITEMGRDLPTYPTLFAKYPEALIGPYDPIVLPVHAADAVDWEGELAIVIGTAARQLDEKQAADAIAGYSVLNDITMRDFQYRSPEWFQGKTFEATTPFGPSLVTVDEFEPGGRLRTAVNGDLVQDAATGDLVFSPPALVSYISQIFTLNPGDIIASGTPGGVGHARKPPRYLRDGDVLTTSIEGLGEIRNPIIGEK